MKNTRNSLVTSATSRSKTSALWTHITELCIRLCKWFSKHDLEILVVIMLFLGAILLVLALRVIANAA